VSIEVGYETVVVSMVWMEIIGEAESAQKRGEFVVVEPDILCTLVGYTIINQSTLWVYGNQDQEQVSYTRPR